MDGFLSNLPFAKEEEELNFLVDSDDESLLMEEKDLDFDDKEKV
jgi:hypothetical protein